MPLITQLGRLLLESCAQFWGQHFKKNTKKWEVAQKSIKRMFGGLANMPDSETKEDQST